LQRVGALLYAALVVAAPIAGSSGDPDPLIPDLIFDEAQPQIPPFWISARAALDSSGQLRNDYLGHLQFHWDLMSDRGEIARRGCLEQGPAYPDTQPHQVPVTSLAKLREFALAVVRGTVAGSEPGFYHRQAGVLLRLDPIEVIAGDITAANAPLFIYYPNARFTIGSYSFCKVDPRATHEPLPGDQLLVFVRTGAGGAERRLIGPLVDDVFFETRDGALIVPQPLRDDPPVAFARSLDDIVAAVAPNGGGR
jgi:hypothetical protein